MFFGDKILPISKRRDVMLGLPYMGSKRKLAGRIIDVIIKDNQKTRYFYDLFGGGGAVSFEAMARNHFERVIYNELNTEVVELLRKIKNEGVTSDFYQWIDRDTFHARKNEPTWFGGWLATCWSFGNNKEKGYLYGKKIDESKQLAHYVVVDKCAQSAIKLSEIIGVDVLGSGVFNFDTISDRRKTLTRFFVRLGKRNDLQHLEHLGRLQYLERLECLKRLENLNKFPAISNASYDQVIIENPDESVIYLDPPYEMTAKYAHDIDHNQLFDWIRVQKSVVYLSSYDAPFQCVAEFQHRSTLSATNNAKQVVEKLYKFTPDKNNIRFF